MAGKIAWVPCTGYQLDFDTICPAPPAMFSVAQKVPPVITEYGLGGP